MPCDWAWSSGEEKFARTIRSLRVAGESCRSSLKDSAHKAERPWQCGRGRSSLFSIYLTWLQYAANDHKHFDCLVIISGLGRSVKSPRKKKRSQVLAPLFSL